MRVWQAHGMPRIDIEALEDEWEDDDLPRSGRRRGLSDYSAEAQARVEEAPEARVTGLDRGSAMIAFEGDELPATYAGSMRGTKVVVGDRVLVRPPRHESDMARILDRLERSSWLSRTADDDEDDERVVVANVDRVAVVIAADNLEAGFGFADRVLLAAAAGGIEPMLVVNRIDLVDTDLRGVVADRYRRGLATWTTSATTGEGVDALADELAGGWTALTGHSGVGKSTLTNALIEDADQTTGVLGARGGRHTTVAARALRLPEGGWLVDTPGVRSFGLGTLDPDDLAGLVPEFEGLDCALDDCRHDGEPGCGVTAADIHPERLANHHRLVALLRGEGQ